MSTARKVDTADQHAGDQLPSPQGAPWRRVAWRVVRISGLVLAVAGGLLAMLVVAYAFINPPASNLMIAHRLAGKPVQHTWVAFERISPNVVHAVVPSEDARFCRHWGIDWGELYHAIANADARGPRGASTITMQTAKNLFLWSDRNYVRKAIEMPLALAMDFVWSKRRMLEVYLNIAEWGPGVFGIEAAARHHFSKSASTLTKREAALLAAALPNPIVRRAGRPGPRTRAYARIVRKRMARGPELAACVF